MTQSPKADDPRLLHNVTMRLDHLKAGEHTLIIPVPPEEIALIGRIVIAWGGFEVRMDALLAHVLDGLKREVPGWRRLGFTKRKELFKDLMVEYTTKMFPHETQTFRDISRRAGDLHWRRNVVSHGYYEIISHRVPGPDGVHPPKYVATGEVKGAKREIEISVESLGKIWHDIAHLGGALMAAIHRMGGQLNAVQEFVIDDRDLLRDQPEGSFRFLPIGTRREDPPQSSAPLSQKRGETGPKG